MVTDRRKRLLGIVRELQPVVIRDLMARDGRSRRSVTMLLKRLRNEGLIEVDVEKQAAGNWTWWYSLTGEGEKVLGKKGEGTWLPFFGFDPFWAEIDRAIARTIREREERSEGRGGEISEGGDSTDQKGGGHERTGFPEGTGGESREAGG